MARIGFFSDTQDGDEGSIECLGAFDYDNDLSPLSKRVYAVTSHLSSFDFYPQVQEEMGPEVIFYFMDSEYFASEFEEDEDLCYADSAEVAMGGDDVLRLPDDPSEAARIVFDTIPQSLREMGYYEVINPLTDATAVDAFIADRTREDEDKAQAEFDRFNVQPGDKVYPVRLNGAQLSGKRAVTYTDSVLSAKRKFARNDRVEEYINAVDVEPYRDVAVEIFPLPSGQKHKWYGRVVDQPMIEVTGNDQEQIRTRLAVVLAARARNAS